ncbi:uncharacterized protein MELLADRAFT_60649 [Melampsora larici-populina 98AG31]|uniref:Thioredoxin-like fold domain-containing protein n=1 Tax=Melampsora larici-populina (strain 98AG31 / pathotype 3-4-7) TaxID=747676 RepID=F4RBU6_MELLP|nr:uncharacterized protein MELLADRAFT_60649 [Melampsora larici-populina 98AG31]EGG10168.1 hypothetical protein MELLADRAFT_60649 [Melampsora larici-populina 98AG31]
MSDKKENTSTQDDPEGCFKIDPEHQYPDRIISRLRLVDGFGKPIVNPKLLFRDCEVVGFFFATLWNPHKQEFHNHVLDFTQKHPHRFKCVYVSIDSKKSDFDLATKDKAWVHMAWNDGSNLDDQVEESDESFSEFVSPYDTKLLNEIFSNLGADTTDPPNTFLSDSRPISRVSLVQQMNILSTPTLSIYHSKKHTWLDQNVRHSLFESPEQRTKAWESWEKGESIGLTWSVLIKLDDSFNLVNLTENLMGLGKPSNLNPSPIESRPKSNHLYSEF